MAKSGVINPTYRGILGNKIDEMTHIHNLFPSMVAALRLKIDSVNMQLREVQDSALIQQSLGVQGFARKN